jgi:DNA-binding FadR family transcriptional regulator
MTSLPPVDVVGIPSVGRGTLTDRVEAMLRARIVSGDWPAGTKLPAIERLAAEAGVSRTVAREAVKALATQGLLDVVHGHGTVVAPSTNRPVVEALRYGMRANADLIGIIEVRLALEVEAASLAAERRTDEDILDLRLKLDRMHAAQDAAAFMEADVAFHEAVVRATHNATFAMVAGSIAELLRETRIAVMKADSARAAAAEAPSPTTQREGREAGIHASIFRSIVAGDRQGAAAAMRGHLCEVRDALADVVRRQANRAGGPGKSEPRSDSLADGADTRARHAQPGRTHRRGGPQ